MRGNRVTGNRIPMSWRAAVMLALPIVFLAAAAYAAPRATDWEGTRPIGPWATAPPRGMPEALSQIGPPRNVVNDISDGQWQRVAPPAGSDRLESSFIYDAGSNRLITFGGVDDHYQYTNTVTALQLPAGTWSTLVTAGTPPSPRRLHGAVYDAANQRMIVYGGWSDSLLNDVWQLTLTGTPTWSEITPSVTGPSARAGSGTVFDSASQRMILYAGFDGGGITGLANDVWALSLSGTPAWNLITPSGSGPAGSYGSSVAYDPSGPALLAFGGYTPDLSNAVWRLSLGGSPAWSLVATAGTAPSSREGQTAQFDPASHRLAVYGGEDGTSIQSDLWILDFAGATPTWSNPAPTPQITPRLGAVSALAADGRMYVYGGLGSGWDVLADVWSVSVANPVSWQTWEILLPPRLQEVMVLDTNRDRLMSFGGTDGAYRNDTWTHSMVYGRGWDPLATSGTPPGPRRLHTGIFDPVGDRLIVFGGYDDTLLGDLWQLSLSGTPTWSPLVASGTGPSPRGGHVAIYDPEGQRMIVFGGYDGVTPPGNRIGDTWELSLSGTPTWTQLSTGPGPNPRSSATAVYDAQHHAMVVFGGTDPNYYNDTWRLSLDGTPSWSLINPSGTLPGPREEQSAVYDSKRDRMVIFGGYNSSLINYGDLRSLDLGDSPAWSQPAPIGVPPSARWGMKALYDPNRDGMWLYGGWADTYQRDLWFLQWFDAPATGAIATHSANATQGTARLEWSLPGSIPNPAIVERSTNGSTWTRVGTVLPTRTGRMVFVDHGVAPGQTRAWRVRESVAKQKLVSAPQWLTIQSTTAVGPQTVAFGVRPDGAASRAGSVAVSCTLPNTGRARVDLLDVTGRLLDSRNLTSAGAGSHRVELGRALPAGLFFVRLTGTPGTARTKVLLLP